MFTSVRRFLLYGCCVMLAPAWTPSALAHYLWVGRAPGTLTETFAATFMVCRGHALNHLHSYSPAAVTAITVLDREGAELSIARTDGKDRVLFTTSAVPSLASVRCDWGARVNTTKGKKFMTRREAEVEGFRVLNSFLSIQTSKTLFEDGDAVRRPAGMVFEFVPVKSPFALGPEESLSLKLLFEGKPLRDAVVFRGEDEHTRTDEKGVVTISPVPPGRHVIAARHTSPADDRDEEIDYYQYMTFIVFEVSQ